MDAGATVEYEMTARRTEVYSLQSHACGQGVELKVNVIRWHDEISQRDEEAPRALYQEAITEGLWRARLGQYSCGQRVGWPSG
jgi:hypothetical protein